MKVSTHIWLRYFLTRFLLLGLLGFLWCFSGFSQGYSGEPPEQPFQHFREALYLQTDRDLYIVGEQAWFKVYKLNALSNKPDNISKVVYIELINHAGYPVSQRKLHVDGKSGSASLYLSDTLSSGNYLLRAYTSWMKNYAEKDFSFKTISIINPFRSVERLAMPDSAPANPAQDTTSMVRTEKRIDLEIKFDKQTYGTREKVQVCILATNSGGNPVEADLSVSIAKSCSFNDNRTNINDLFLASVGDELVTHLAYLPELEGIILTGTLMNSDTDKPMGNESVVFSTVGKVARCQVYKTSDSGKFHFNVDESGVQEIVIQPVDSVVRDYYVELEPDFFNAYDHYLPGSFYLDTSKLQELNKSIINMQIENIYKPYRQNNHNLPADNHEVDFYAEPEYAIQISDYIPLKTIREVIKEVVPTVVVRTKDGRSYLRLSNGVDKMVFANRPFVLVDGVPFDDIDQILNISLTELERIEVINLRYFMDDHVFDGIIQFKTKKGTLEGLEFDHAVFRQAFATFSRETRFSSPAYGSDSLRNSSLPDFRNTLYWNPYLQTQTDGVASFEFYTSDATGDYTVFIEGISPDGKTGAKSKQLIVNQTIYGLK